MKQKVLKIGSSAGITIPKNGLKTLGIKIGDDIEVNFDENGMTAVPAASSVEVDSELLNWSKGFIEKYRDALEALKDK